VARQPFGQAGAAGTGGPYATWRSMSASSKFGIVEIRHQKWVSQNRAVEKLGGGSNRRRTG
jgi:hypothetical protein